MLFTFPSRYWFTIGRRKIFSLGRWSSRIPARFLVSRGTWEHHREILCFRLRGFHSLWPDFPDRSTSKEFCNSPVDWRIDLMSPATPNAQRSPALTYVRFRLFPVRSPLLRKSQLLSLPGGTEMFQFSPFASMDLCIQSRILQVYPQWVSPFGNFRINACLQLPETYRSLPRPSSLSDAKASTMCPQ